MARKPTSEPAPSVTFQIEVMEYGAANDVTISYWLFMNESWVMAGVPEPATSVAPVQLVKLVLVVLMQLANDARLAALSVVTEPPIWLFSRIHGGAVGAVNPASFNTNSMDAVEPDVFWMSRLADSSLARLAVPGELDRIDRLPRANTPSVAEPPINVEPDAPLSRVTNVAAPSRL